MPKPHLTCALLLAVSLLACQACGRRKLNSDEIARNTAFAEILKREDARDIGSDGLLERSLFDATRPQVQLWSATALGRIGDPAAIPWLCRAATTCLATVRAASAFALGEIEDREIVRLEGRSTDPRVLRTLTDLLDDSSPQVRARAIEALGKAGGRPEALQILGKIGEYRGSTDPAERLLVEKAISAFVRLKEPEAGPWLARVAAGPDPELQWNALNALYRRRDPACCQSSLALLRSPHPDVQAHAARGAGLCGDPTVAGRLADLLGPAEPATGRTVPEEVRSCALQGLAALKTPASVEAIARALQSRPIDSSHPAQIKFAIQAASTLAATGGDTAEAELSRLLRVPGPVANGAVIALASLLRGNPARFFDLAAVTGSDVRRTDAAALRAWAQALGELGGDQARQELQKMLAAAADAPSGSPAAMGVPEVLNALAKMAAASLGTIIPVYLGSHDPVVLRAAVSAYEPSPSDSRPWAPLVDAFRRVSRFDDPETKVAVLDRLEPWVGTPEVQSLLREALSDSSRNARIAAARWLRVAGAAGIPASAGPVSNLRGDFSYGMLAGARRDRSVVILDTSRGSVEIELFREEAPLTTDNFCKLVRSGYFKGLSFMRVVPYFVVQGGDPRNDQEGGPGYSIRCEINMRPFGRGSVGMALAGKDTGGSQFFIALSPQPHLDGGYTNFGRVVAGMQVVDSLVPGDRILGARVEEDVASLEFRRY